MAARRGLRFGRAAALGSAVALSVAGAAPSWAENAADERASRNSPRSATAEESPVTVGRDVYDDALGIVEDLRALREPSLFDYGSIDIDGVQGGYRLTLGDVRFIPDEDGYAEAGDVTLDLAPEGDGYRVSGFRLPAHMPMRRAPGEAELGDLDVPDYSLAGHWSATEQALLSLEVNVRNLRIERAVPHRITSFELGRSSFVDTRSADGIWSETGEFEIRRLESDAGGKRAQIAAITGRWNADRVNLQAADEMVRIFSAIAESEAGSGTATPEDVRRLRRLGPIFGSFGAEFEMREIAIADDAARSFGVSRARIELGGEDLDRDLSRLTLDLGLEGMKLAGPDQAASDLESLLAPEQLDLSLAVEDLPGRAVWDTVLAGLATPDGAPEDEAMARLGQELQAAGTKLRISSSRMISAAAELYATGMLQAYGPGALGFIVAVSLDATGLERLSALASGEGQSDEAVALRDLVAWFDRYGRPGTTPDGAPARHVDIAIDPDGQLTVNGLPLPLFGAPPSEMEN